MSKIRKNTLQGLICLLLSLTVIGAAACGATPSGGNSSSSVAETDSSSSVADEEQEDGEDETDSSNDSVAGDPMDDPNDGKVEGDSAMPPLPPLDDYNPEKTVTREETDALGHNIVYYSDGTWQDLGRVIPLDFSAKEVATKYGYKAFQQAEKSSSLCGLYEDIYDAAVAFSASEEDLALSDDRYLIAELDCQDYALTVNEVAAVFKTFKQDFPEFFWLSQSAKTTYASDSHLAVGFYLCADEAYAQGQVRTKLTEDVRAMAFDCDEYLNGKMSLTERALTVHDYLIDKITYAYETDGVTPEDAVWAHNIIGATDGKGVCETYAKSYAYLCGLFGLECLVVDGNGVNESGAQAHAWNYLYLENEWRLVDVTWDDGFEKNYDGIIGREWFGADITATTASHIPNFGGEGMEYQYALPTLSSQRLNPVLYGEAWGEETMAISPESAFKKMTNAQGRYEMKLYPATNVTEAKTLSVYPVGAKINSDFPTVKELSVSAERLTVGEGYLLPKLTSDVAVSLNGNIVLDGISWDSVGIDLNGHGLITSGFSVELNAQNGVSGLAGSSLTVSTTYATVITWLNLPLINLYDGEWGLKLQKGGTVGTVKGHGGEIWLNGKQTFSVGSFQKGEDEVTEVAVYVEFAALDEYAQFSVTGECDVCVAYHIRGKIDGVWAESEQLPSVLLQWGEASLADLKIYFIKQGYLYDRTGDYALKDGAIVYKL